MFLTKTKFNIVLIAQGVFGMLLKDADTRKVHLLRGVGQKKWGNSRN